MTTPHRFSLMHDFFEGRLYVLSYFTFTRFIQLSKLYSPTVNSRKHSSTQAQERSFPLLASPLLWLLNVTCPSSANKRNALTLREGQDAITELISRSQIEPEAALLIAAARTNSLQTVAMYANLLGLNFPRMLTNVCDH